MQKQFEIPRTKIKGGCQSGRKVVPHDSNSDLPLVISRQSHHSRQGDLELGISFYTDPFSGLSNFNFSSYFFAPTRSRSKF